MNLCRTNGDDPATPTLHMLNDDCLLHLFRYLVPDIYNISVTCRRFRYVAEQMRCFNTLKITACCPHPNDNVDTIDKFSHQVDVFGNGVRNIILNLKYDQIIDEEFIRHIYRKCPNMRYLELGNEIPRNLMVELCREIFPTIEALLMRRRDLIDWQTIDWSECKFNNLRELSLYRCQELDMATLTVYGLEKLIMHSSKVKNLRLFLEQNRNTLHSLILGRHVAREGDLKQLGELLPNLRMLALTEVQLRPLGNMENLLDLRVVNCVDMWQMLNKLSTANRLESLCYHESILNDHHMDFRMLARMTSLKSLSLCCRAGINVETTRIVDSLHWNVIEHLMLTDVRLNLQALKDLITKSPNLKVISVRNLGFEILDADYEDLVAVRPGLVFANRIAIQYKQPDYEDENNDEDEAAGGHHVATLNGLTMEEFVPQPLPCTRSGRCESSFEIQSDDMCQRFFRKEKAPITLCHAHCCKYHKVNYLKSLESWMNHFNAIFGASNAIDN